MKKLKAERTVSRGIAVAKAYVHLEADLKPAEGKIADEQKGAEFDAFVEAREAVAVKLEAMGQTNEIFAAHATIVRDPILEDGVARIEGENCNVQQADLAIGMWLPSLKVWMTNIFGHVRPMCAMSVNRLWPL